eukprot:3406101-Pyramimonas_sp.AAC.1
MLRRCAFELVRATHGWIVDAQCCGLRPSHECVELPYTAANRRRCAALECDNADAQIDSGDERERQSHKQTLVQCGQDLRSELGVEFAHQRRASHWNQRLNVAPCARENYAVVRGRLTRPRTSERSFTDIQPTFTKVFLKALM